MAGTRYLGDSRGSNQLGDDLYAVLGVSPDAEIGELTSAYRRRLRQLPPDTHGQHRVPGELGGSVQPSLAQVLHAYAILRDPTRRASYDRARANRPQHSSPTASTAVRIPVHRRRGTSSSQAWIRVGPVRRHLDQP
jgi:curved DNA-binding protein CbpA